MAVFSSPSVLLGRPTATMLAWRISASTVICHFLVRRTNEKASISSEICQRKHLKDVALYGVSLECDMTPGALLRVTRQDKTGQIHSAEHSSRTELILLLTVNVIREMWRGC